MNTLKVALIGTGNIAQAHLDVLSEFDDVSIVGIANRSKENGEKLAEFKEKEDPSNNEFSIINIEKKMIVSTTVDFENNKYKRPY